MEGDWPSLWDPLERGDRFMILANTQKGFAHDYLLFISFVLNQIKVCYNLIRRSCESIDLVYLEFDWLNDLGSRYPFLAMRI